MYVDFLSIVADCCNRDLEATANRRFFDQFESCRQRSKQRVTAHEPVARPLCWCRPLAILAADRLRAAGDTDRAGDRLGECMSKDLLPGFLSCSEATSGRIRRTLDHVRERCSRDAVRSEVGRHPLLAKVTKQCFLGPSRQFRTAQFGQVPKWLGRRAQLQRREELPDHALARRLPLPLLEPLLEM